MPLSIGYRMPKRAVSVTLDADNLVWLRAQAGARRNVSRIVNELVGEARAAGRRFGAVTRSVAGTVDLRRFDPAAADQEVRARFDAALCRRSGAPARPGQSDGKPRSSGSR